MEQMDLKYHQVQILFLSDISNLVLIEWGQLTGTGTDVVVVDVTLPKSYTTWFIPLSINKSINTFSGHETYYYSTMKDVSTVSIGGHAASKRDWHTIGY